jgi:hypothetical protein
MKTLKLNQHLVTNTLIHLIVICVFLLACLWIFGCGKEDQRNETCAMYGCEPSPSPTPTSTTTRSQPGPKGADGSSCTTKSTDTGAVIECDDGTTSTISNGTKGNKGDTGAVGPKGLPGTSGRSCTVATTATGAIISCDDGTTSTISNGTNGSVIVPVIACPEKAGAFPEVMLCIDNKLFAVYGDPARISYVEVVPGSYISTDGRSCTFNVVEKCKLSY